MQRQIQADLNTEGVLRVDTDSKSRKAKEEIMELSHCSFRVEDWSVCRLWYKQSFLCKSRILLSLKARSQAQRMSENVVSIGKDIVSSFVPKAGEIKVRGKFVAVNGT
jgi:hypothetical protein